MKVYIPFNMIIDTDFGIIRIVEKLQNLSEYPVNKLKSFLLKRLDENPIPEYNKIRGINVSKYIYDIMLEEHYEKTLELSMVTDMIAFVVNTYKMGLFNEVEIVIGCNYKCEMDFIKKILSSLDHTVETQFTMNLNLNEFDCIFTKYIDDNIVSYLLDYEEVKGKRIYVADYQFNTLYDEETNTYIINPELHLRLESEGNIVSIVSLYNKKQGGKKNERSSDSNGNKGSEND